MGADLTATYRQVIQVSACTVEGGRSGGSLQYMYYISFRFTDERNLQEKFNFCVMYYDMHVCFTSTLQSDCYHNGPTPNCLAMQKGGP